MEFMTLATLAVQNADRAASVTAVPNHFLLLSRGNTEIFICSCLKKEKTALPTAGDNLLQMKRASAADSLNLVQSETSKICL